MVLKSEQRQLYFTLLDFILLYFTLFFPQKIQYLRVICDFANTGQLFLINKIGAYNKRHRHP
jgi:hypothetical protein